ncbi:MAG: hypothetical protein ACK4YP_18310, partial [Myxococcota bacterium]
MRLPRPVAALLLALLAAPVHAAPRAAPEEPAPPALPVDWAAAGDATAALLSDYLRVDTTNPPGNEERGADFLATRLAAAGIPSEKIVHAPGRASLVARLRARLRAVRRRPCA